MSPTTSLEMYLFYTCAAVLNLAFGVFFFISRAKADPGMLTKSQRWGLTLLGSIFLLNGLAVVSEATTRGATAALYDLVCLAAIAFAIVYPRPAMSWKGMGIPLAALAAFGMAGVLALILTRDEGLIRLIWYGPELIAFTLFPLFLLWRSRNENSMQTRMVMTIVAWGFMFNASMLTFRSIFGNIVGGANPANIFTDTDSFLFMATLVVLGILLWRRRGSWGAPERFNLVFMLLLLLSAFILAELERFGDMRDPRMVFILKWLNSCWVWVRPLLLAFGLLRYQLFGTALKVNQLLLWLGWLVIIIFILTWGEVLLLGASPEMMMGAGFAMVLVAAYPALALSRMITSRLLPLTAGEEGTNLVQQRAAYLLSLRTAVDNGEVPDGFDRKALQNLRRMLGISEREHELLMASFPRKKAGEEAHIQELFLILSDGRLVAHVGSLEEEKEIVAGMLTAIRGFARDGLKAGQKELDTVKYGDFTLMMESEGKLLLAALVLGPETANVRVRLRDCLLEAERTAGPALRKWSGELEGMEPVKKLLAAALAPAKAAVE